MNIAIYTNILTPYRIHFYNCMYNECKNRGDSFHVILMADTEPNRNWTYDTLKTDYTILLKHKTFSYGETYIHYNCNLIETLKELKPDLLICAGSYLSPGIWSVLKYEKKSGYKSYFWSESHLNEQRNYSRFKVLIREYLRKRIYRKFDGFWYAGQLSKQFIETYCNTDTELYYMPNLVEENKYKRERVEEFEERKNLRKKYGIQDENVVFFCPARLSPVKGLDLFIPLLSKAKNHERVTLLIAGDGELREKIVEQAKRYELDVRLLGFQNQKNVIELYHAADVFLLPSLSDSNPLTCIEALWAGLPMFISEHCGNYPEVISSGKNGYSFRYDDADTTKEHLDAIIDADENWRMEAGKISLEIARQRYDSVMAVQRILQEMQTHLF